MSSTFQIVQPDGRVGPQVSVDEVVSQIAHGRVLGFDLLRSADGSVSSVSDHAACARIVAVLAKRSTSGSRAALSHQIASVARNSASGRLLVWSNQQSQQRAFAFRDGRLVGARSSVSGEIESTGETPKHRAARAAAVVKALGCVLAEGMTHFSFIEDPDIADSEVASWFVLRDALEAALHGFVPMDELWNSADMLGTTKRDPGRDAGSLDPVDEQLVRRFDGVEVTRQVVSQIAQSGSWSVDDILVRLHLLVAWGALKGQTASAPLLRRTAQRLGNASYFDALDIGLNATPEDVEAAFNRQADALGALEQSEDDQAIRLARRQIYTALETARDTLSDPHSKTVYQRAQRLGLDFGDKAVRDRLLKEHLLSYAQKKLDASQFDDAEEALGRVVRDHPDDEDVHVKLGWAAFLNSDRSAAQADEAAVQINRAIAINRESDIAYLTLGKIYRLAQVRDKALRNLRKATELNPQNSEAWALLRNVNVHKSGPGTGGLKLQLDVGEGLMPVMALLFFVFALLYVGANVVPGGPKEWPKVGAGTAASVSSSVKATQFQTELASQVRKRLEGEVDYRIPSGQQVMGSVESYYLVDDTWFWSRRGILVLFALIGIFGIARKTQGNIPIVGRQPLFMFLAIPYGIAVGFLSPTPATPTGLEMLLGMTLVHVLAEQLFFFGFVGRALSRSIESPLVAITASALIFGAYHFTYFGTMQADPSTMLMGVAQIGAFAGGAYAALWYFSGGLFVPLLAHLLINGTMMFRTVQQYAG